MHPQKAIEQLGYSPNEAKVYLAALYLGESLVSDIARKTRLPRSSVQVLIDKLERDGLMQSYIKRRYKYWVAERPEHLVELLHQREEAIRAALPRLLAFRSHKAPKSFIKILTNGNVLDQLYQDVLQTRQPLLSLVPSIFWETFEDANTAAFIQMRVKRSIPTRLLAPKTLTSEKMKARDQKELRTTRFLPSNIVVPTAIFIYGDKVAFGLLNKAEPTVIIIEDPDIRETKSLFFEDLWDRADTHVHGEGRPQAKEMFRSFADDAPLPVMIADESMRIEYVNAAWEKRFGRRLSEMRHKPARVFKKGAILENLQGQLSRPLEAGERPSADAIVFRKKANDGGYLETIIFPTRHNGRRYYIQIYCDIAERKQAELLRQEVLQRSGTEVVLAMKRLNGLHRRLSESGHSDIVPSMKADLAKIKHLMEKILNA